LEYYFELLDKREALSLTFGGMCSWRPDASGRWRVFLHSWCGAGLCGNYFILALAKTVTPGGSARVSGPACAAITNLSGGREVFAAQKPIAYTDLLGTVVLFVIV